MNQERSVIKIVPGKQTTDGAGVHLTRVLSLRETREFDPFLMLDWFDSVNPNDYTAGFPWHPHRGIETVTFLFHGDIEHADSMQNRGHIRDGDCQWMTAGSGIIHQEMPIASPLMRGLQLWVNLAAAEKMTKPKYRDILRDDIPEVNLPGATVRVIAGWFEGVSGPTTGVSIQPTFLDIHLEPEATLSIPTKNDETVFAFLVSGTGQLAENAEVHEDHAAYLFSTGDVIHLKASDQGIHLLLFAGKPLHEPISWGGPIVMNTREELELAFHELDNGTFIK